MLIRLPSFPGLSIALVALLFTSACQTVPVAGNAAPLVAVSGKLTDNEAARLALLNNAAFREVLADLGIAKAELLLANELPNPGLSVLFPLGPKQLEYTAKLPAETIWLRPQRVAIAKLNTEEVGKRLVQSGLDLVRDVKVACADLRLAERRVELTQEDVDLLNRFSKLADARLQAGDISELEADNAETDALRARIDRDRSPHDVQIAREKLRNLLGVSNESADFTLAGPGEMAKIAGSEAAILKRAFAARPDLRAAVLAIEKEGKRIGLVEKEIFQMLVVFDANGAGSNFEAGPGLELKIPIFNQNQGIKAQADAQFQKAVRHYAVVRDQIALEVRQSLIRFRQAQTDLKSVREELLPALNQTIDKTERAWEGGEVSYLFVLESIRKVQSAKLREAESYAEWQRAAAELERSVGSPAVLESVEKAIKP